MLKFARNLGPAPDRHCTKLDGPSIKPSIHIRARHQARLYILLVIAVSFWVQQLAFRPCKSSTGPDLVPSAGSEGSNFTSLIGIVVSCLLSYCLFVYFLFATFYAQLVNLNLTSADNCKHQSYGRHTIVKRNAAFSTVTWSVSCMFMGTIAAVVRGTATNFWVRIWEIMAPKLPARKSKFSPDIG